MHSSPATPSTDKRTNLNAANRRQSGRRTLPFAQPDIGDEEVAAVEAVLRSGWLTSGPEVVAFEEEFARAVKVRHAIAVNSATAALHLALVACDIGPEDGVVVPAFTFAATAEVVCYCGALPILLDVDPESYLLTPAILRHFLAHECESLSSNGREAGLIHRQSGRRVRAVMAVHIAGRPCEIDELIAIADEYRLELIEDAAHAVGSSYRGRPIGSAGRIAAFSFYATKNVTTGEGGMLTCNDDQIARRLRRLRLHGIEGQTYGRRRWRYDVVEQGYKYNLNDMAAALGRVQLRRAAAMQSRRRQIAERYSAALADLPLKLPRFEPNEDSYHLYILQVLPSASMARDQLVEELYSCGIATSLHFIPLYRHSFYREQFGYTPQPFPGCEEAYSRILSLPLYSAMSDEDVEDVISALRQIMAQEP